MGTLTMTLLLSSCNTKETNQLNNIETGNPTVEEILVENENADIFLLNGIVYSNAEQIDWVVNQELTVGQEVLEITKQTSDSHDFSNGSATKLPVGTKIYEKIDGNGDIVIAIVEGKEIRYLGLREG
ncbi:hypothetical protein ACFOZY_00370 [Chungangia koreensis]|uniref:Uncharacterized protein n=1 Tax=Chungangia koreensis TaxID=752657 RepID=A0ABV8WZ20_9LACT